METTWWGSVKDHYEEGYFGKEMFGISYSKKTLGLERFL